MKSLSLCYKLDVSGRTPCPRHPVIGRKAADELLGLLWKRTCSKCRNVLPNAVSVVRGEVLSTLLASRIFCNDSQTKELISAKVKSELS